MISKPSLDLEDDFELSEVSDTVEFWESLLDVLVPVFVGFVVVLVVEMIIKHKKIMSYYLDFYFFTNCFMN